jgi:hypothetical protein
MSWNRYGFFQSEIHHLKSLTVANLSHELTFASSHVCVSVDGVQLVVLKVCENGTGDKDDKEQLSLTHKIKRKPK